MSVRVFESGILMGQNYGVFLFCLVSLISIVFINTDTNSQSYFQLATCSTYHTTVA